MDELIQRNTALEMLRSGVQKDIMRSEKRRKDAERGLKKEIENQKELIEQIFHLKSSNEKL